jgi:hypothetical protein
MSGRAIDSSVTLDEVFTVVSAKRVPLAPELAGYLALEIAEHADPNGGDVDPKSVLVGEEGTVALIQPKRKDAQGDAEASIRAALGRLLEAAGSQTPSLVAASKRGSGLGLTGLAEELEAALIPVNRAAGRRALARLAREVRRVTLGVGRNSPLWGGNNVGAPGSRRAVLPLPAAENEQPDIVSIAAPPPAANTPPASEEAASKREPEPLLDEEGKGSSRVDALIATFGVSAEGDDRHARELKAMADIEPTPPPPSENARRGGVDSVDSDLESLLASSAHSPAPALMAPSDATFRQRLASGSSMPQAGMPDETSRWRSSAIAVSVAMAAIAAAAYGVFRSRSGGADGTFAEGGVVKREDVPSTASARPYSGGAPDVPPLRAPAVSAPSACRGTLVVSNVPPLAEVLVRGGQAPVDIERMPVGARLELVATAEGFAPRRVVIPAGANWDVGVDGKPRFEAAVQLDKSRAQPGTNDPWPPGDPGTEVGGSGPPGTLHVVASPHGAEIWMVEGVGPEARIEGASCSDGIDVLLAGPTSYRKRLHVSANDFVPDEGSPRSMGGGTTARIGQPPLVARVDAR